MKHYVILGAGVSGLSLGWFLKRRFTDKIKLTVIDQADYPGGWASTDFQEGFLFEQGPRSLRPKGTGIETLRLIEQLNLQHQVIVADPSAQKRYVWSKNKLRRLPRGPLSLFASPLTRGVPWKAFCECFRSKGKAPDESIASFFSRRFSDKIAQQLIDPMTAGIYAGDIRNLSIRSCFPSLFEWEQKYGSVMRGALKRKKRERKSQTPFIEKIQKHPIYSFKGGMETLTDALAQKIEPELLLGTKVKGLKFSPDHVEIKLEQGAPILADHVFCTLPATKIAPFFDTIHQELATLLMSISCASVATVNVGYHRTVLKKKGFGYLIPSQEEENILGCVFDSSVFPQQNLIPEESRMTVMIGGMRGPQVNTLDHDSLEEMALSALSRHLGIDYQPDAVCVQTAISAIPQYFVGHHAKIDRIGTILARIFPLLTLTGNSYLGVSVNDCIANSKRIEESLLSCHLQ